MKRQVLAVLAVFLSIGGAFMLWRVTGTRSNAPVATVASTARATEKPAVAPPSASETDRPAEPIQTSRPQSPPVPLDLKSGRELLANLVHEMEAASDADTAEQEASPSLAKAMHKRLLLESADPAWAADAQALIIGYFSTRPGDFRSRFEIAVVECRTSLCEIQAASVRVDETLRDGEIWNDAVHAMQREPWWPAYEFREPAIRQSNTPEGRRLLLLTFLLRRSAAEADAAVKAE